MQAHELRDYHRLRAEGRWHEANQFREAERTKLRAAGRTRQQACDESWRAMLAAYPPHPSLEAAPASTERPVADPSPPPHNLEVAAMLAKLRTHDRRVDFETDWEWAYANMAFADVSPQSIPSPSALAVWKFARAEPHKFLEKFLSYHEKKRKELPPDPRHQERDKQTQFQALDRLVQSLEVCVESTLTEMLERWPDEVVAVSAKLGWQVTRRSTPPPQ